MSGKTPSDKLRFGEEDIEPGGGEAMTVAVGSEAAGQRLDKYLAAALPDLTRTRLKALIEEGCVTAGGAAAQNPSAKVREGETYTVALPEAAPAAPAPEAIPLDILYEDQDLIVVNKPAGLVVHPAAGNPSGTLVNALLHHCGESLSGIGGVARPGIVHRLDKETSGVMVAAKNDRAHQALSEAFAAHDLERAYLALVAGTFRPRMGTVDAALARHPNDRKKMAVARDDHPSARHAVTHYKTLAVYGEGRAKLAGDAVASLMECRLETGRTHQIRVHMAHAGHAVLGDPVYGRSSGLAGLSGKDVAAAEALDVLGSFRRQALHAAVLGFIHPVTEEEMRFEAPPPEDFARLVTVLNNL